MNSIVDLPLYVSYYNYCACFGAPINYNVYNSFIDVLRKLELA